MSEMRLAAAGWTMQHERCRGPIGPSIDPLDGRDVASRNHEIRSPESRTAGQVESELDHTKRIIVRARWRESPKLSQSLLRARKYARPPHEVGQPRHNRGHGDHQAQDKVGPACRGTETQPRKDKADQDYLDTCVELADIQWVVVFWDGEYLDEQEPADDHDVTKHDEDDE